MQLQVTKSHFSSSLANFEKQQQQSLLKRSRCIATEATSTFIPKALLHVTPTITLGKMQLLSYSFLIQA